MKIIFCSKINSLLILSFHELPHVSPYSYDYWIRAEFLGIIQMKNWQFLLKDTENMWYRENMNIQLSKSVFLSCPHTHTHTHRDHSGSQLCYLASPHHPQDICFYTKSPPSMAISLKVLFQVPGGHKGTAGCLQFKFWSWHHERLFPDVFSDTEVSHSHHPIFSVGTAGAQIKCLAILIIRRSRGGNVGPDPASICTRCSPLAAPTTGYFLSALFRGHIVYTTQPHMALKTSHSSAIVVAYIRKLMSFPCLFPPLQKCRHLWPGLSCISLHIA